MNGKGKKTKVIMLEQHERRRLFSSKGLYSSLNILLFCVMAEVAYLAIIFYTDVLKRCDTGNAFSLAIFVACPLIFCLICFSLLRLNHTISRKSGSYGNLFRIFFYFVLIGVVFWLFNYLLYVVAVALSANDGGSPFFPTEPIWPIITVVSFAQLIVVCLIALNQMARFAVRMLRENEASKQEQARAEVRALQTQLNPHFLFNSLNTLVSEIDYDPEEAKEFTIGLANAYRYILQKQDKPLVTVYEELGFLKTYINLNRIRVGDSLSYECVYPDRSNLDFLQYRFLPSLSLQLLAENALKHNVVSAIKPLKISIRFSEDLHYLIVRNNINPKKSVHSLGKGLKNLSERYRLLSGENIVVERSADEFTVKLPMLDGNETR